MPSSIAVAHYPEGAGHATRMLAVADELRALGAEVLVAGGGAGSEFVALNGYEAFEPTDVDYVRTYQDGSMTDLFTRTIPASAGRVRDYATWLADTEPDALVTDDMFAAMAAARTDVPMYVVKHDMPALYEDILERAGARFHTAFQSATARDFFYPAVWSGTDMAPADATAVGPMALEGDETVTDGPDVVVVPSHFSDLSDVATRLEGRGYDVLDVAADDWDPVPSLLPYVEAADAVVCSGYSTIMDAAVAGTPCVVYPETTEQEAVGDWIAECEVEGFRVAEHPEDVLAAVESPPGAPNFENGAKPIAETVVSDLDGTAGVPSGDDKSEDAQSESVRDRVRSARPQLVGDASRAAMASVCAVGLAGVAAHQVATRGVYGAIEQTLPTYAGTIQEPFLFAALGLVLLATVGATLEAGMLPSLLLSSSPVFGWAANHWIRGTVHQYAATFPLEMVILYGGVFGTVGYLLGMGLRDLHPRRRRMRASG